MYMTEGDGARVDEDDTVWRVPPEATCGGTVAAAAALVVLVVVGMGVVFEGDDLAVSVGE